jgi:RNA polymerase sigma factor for flagellar operon FliA
LARRVFERAPDASVQIEDLISSGAIGLLEAFDRFDPTRGIQFSTYAEYRIRGAMYDTLRSNDTFTRRRRQLAKRLDNAAEAVRRRTGDAPEPQDIADQLEMSLEQYWVALDQVKPISHTSINATEEGEDESRPLLERIMDPNNEETDAKMMIAEVKAQLQRCIEELPDRQRKCVLMYYGKEMSLAEISKVYGVTVSRVSQILSEAREKLRKKLAPVVERTDLTMQANR